MGKKIKVQLDMDLLCMDFEIKLEENTYNAGETAKGILLINADKALKVRKLKFSVCGKEGYEERGVS